jgi:predicted Zn finger-like uncharacterized protein
MKVKCSKCGTIYNLKDSLVTDKPRKVRCAKCNSLFIIRRPTSPPIVKSPSKVKKEAPASAPGLKGPPKPAAAEPSATPSPLPSEPQKIAAGKQDIEPGKAPGKTQSPQTPTIDPSAYVKTQEMPPYSSEKKTAEGSRKTAETKPPEAAADISKKPEKRPPAKEHLEPSSAESPQRLKTSESKPSSTEEGSPAEHEETSPFIHGFASPEEPSALDKVSSDSLFTDGKIFADAEEKTAKLSPTASEKEPSKPPSSDDNRFIDTISQPPYKPEAAAAAAQITPDMKSGEPPSTDAMMPSTQQVKAPSREQKFKVKVEGEEYEDIDLMTVKKWIREGRLEPMDEVQSEGGEWVIAADIPILMKYFRLKESIEASRPREGVIKDRSALEYCTTHPQEPARWKCSSCGRKFCSQCVKYETFGHIRVPVCDRCKDRCVEIKPPKMLKPFWAQIPQMLAYPFVRGGAWMTIIGFIVSFLPYIGLIIYPYSLYILKASAQGKKQMPDWPDFTDIWEDILAPTFRLILGSIIVFVPLVIYLSMKFAFIFDLSDFTSFYRIIFDPINIVFIIFAWIYLPMVTIIVAVFNRLIPALNPITVFKLIGAIKKEYFIALFLALALGIVSGVIGAMLGIFPVIGKYLGKGVNWYFLIVEMHMLGLMVYQVEEKLGWD